MIALDLPGFGAAPSLPPGVEPTARGARRQRSATSSPPAASTRPHVAGNSLGAWVGLELGRIGAARSVTCLSPAGLWRAPIGPRQEPHPRVGAAPAPAGRRSPSAIPPLRRRALTTFSAHPDRIPAAAGRELVLGWIDADGYDGANKAMREHIFEPAGYPPASEVPVTIAWAEHDKLVGPPQPECRPAGARFLVLPDVGHTPMWDDPELVAQTILEGSAPTGSTCFRSSWSYRPLSSEAPEPDQGGAT